MRKGYDPKTQHQTPETLKVRYKADFNTFHITLDGKERIYQADPDKLIDRRLDEAYKVPDDNCELGDGRRIRTPQILRIIQATWDAVQQGDPVKDPDFSDSMDNIRPGF